MRSMENIRLEIENVVKERTVFGGDFALYFELLAKSKFLVMAESRSAAEEREI